MSRKGAEALVFLVVLAAFAAFVHLDPLETGPPEAEAVIDCDGRSVVVDGKEAELLRLHNEARAEHGVPPLCVQAQLTVAAQAHADDMLRRGFYEHVTPEGLDPGARLSRAGYPFLTYGENNNRVSGGFPSAGEPGRRELREAFEGWMGSPGHRENLLNPAFREVGFGFATGRYAPEPGTTTMYVADFGARHPGVQAPGGGGG